MVDTDFEVDCEETMIRCMADSGFRARWDALMKKIAEKVEREFGEVRKKS